MEYIRVEIASLSLVPSGGGSCAIVLRETDGSRFLPVVIGLLEAQAIAVKIQGMPMPRPLTHDLLNAVMLEVKCKLQRVTIDNVREGTFFATMEIDHDGRIFKIDSRPSDAIALAVRSSAPIFVAEHVMDKAGATPDTSMQMPSSPDDISPMPPSAKKSASKSRQAPARQLSPTEELEEEMKSAIDAEDYERAAQIRDEIHRLKDNPDNDTNN